MSPWQVARWRDDYGIDGIDLDLEEGAGSKKVTTLTQTSCCCDIKLTSALRAGCWAKHGSLRQEN